MHFFTFRSYDSIILPHPHPARSLEYFCIAWLPIKLKPTDPLNLDISNILGINEVASMSPHCGSPDIKNIGLERSRESYSNFVASSLTISNLTPVNLDISCSRNARSPSISIPIDLSPNNFPQ